MPSWEVFRVGASDELEWNTSLSNDAASHAHARTSNSGDDLTRADRCKRGDRDSLAINLDTAERDT